MNIPELLDKDGYPTDEFLQFIRDYKPSQMPIMEFIELIRESWWHNEWGVVLKREYKGSRMLQLHTGGWSGNESIIDAILSNIYLTQFAMRYIMWTRGGHYCFKIKVK